MTFKEVLETLKKYPLSNNFWVTGKKSCSTTKGCCSENKGYGLPYKEKDAGKP